MIQKKDINEIYEAALTVFAEYGYKKATLNDIAKKLNMTAGNFYRYFNSKQELYRETVGYYLRKWQTHSRNSIPSDKGVQTQFTIMLQNALEYLSINDNFRKLLEHDPDIFPVFPDNDPYEIINNDSVQLIRSVVQKGIKSKEFRDTDLEQTTQLIWLIYKTFITQIYIKNHNDESIKDSWKIFIDLITNGLFNK